MSSRTNPKVVALAGAFDAGQSQMPGVARDGAPTMRDADGKEIVKQGVGALTPSLRASFVMQAAFARARFGGVALCD